MTRLLRMLCAHKAKFSRGPLPDAFTLIWWIELMGHKDTGSRAVSPQGRRVYTSSVNTVTFSTCTEKVSMLANLAITNCVGSLRPSPRKQNKPKQIKVASQQADISCSNILRNKRKLAGEIQLLESKRGLCKKAPCLRMSGHYACLCLEFLCRFQCRGRLPHWCSCASPGAGQLHRSRRY